MKKLKIHKLDKTWMGTLCRTNWVDNGKERVTILISQWKKVNCKRCLKYEK